MRAWLLHTHLSYPSCMYPFSIPIKPPPIPPPSHPRIEKREGEILEREKWHLSLHAEHFVFSFRHCRQPFGWVGIDSSLSVPTCSLLLKKNENRSCLELTLSMTKTVGEVDPNAIKYPVSKMKALKAIDGFFYYFFLVWESLHCNKINGRLFGGPSLEYICPFSFLVSHVFTNCFLKITFKIPDFQSLQSSN